MLCAFLDIGMYPGDQNDATVVIGNEEASTQVEVPAKQFVVQIREDFFTNDIAGHVLEKGLIVASAESKLCNNSSIFFSFYCNIWVLSPVRAGYHSCRVMCNYISMKYVF